MRMLERCFATSNHAAASPRHDMGRCAFWCSASGRLFHQETPEHRWREPSRSAIF